MVAVLCLEAEFRVLSEHGNVEPFRLANDLFVGLTFFSRV
jgi:hypothetical protein